jgi:hypothetical protein
MTDLDAILARLERLERLETENAALRRRLDELDRPSAATAAEPGPHVSRRDVLRRAGSGAAALGIGALGASMAALSQPAPVRADGEAITVGGTFTDATQLTTLQNSTNNTSVFVGRSKAGGTGVVGESASGFGGYFVSGSGNGVYGMSTGLSSSAIGVHGVGPGQATGVQGESGTGFGVEGESISGTGVRGRSQSGYGVVGDSASGSGISGSAGSGTGIEGSSTSGTGVRGSSTTGIGVAGSSDQDDGVQGVSQAGSGVTGISVKADGVSGKSSAPDGVGVRGYARDEGGLINQPRSGKFGTGVLGSSGSAGVPPAARANTGVMGVGTNGRGGVFIGSKAQVQLVPSSAATHPTAGSRGDLFVDKSGRLWFCAGGSTWKQVA